MKKIVFTLAATALIAGVLFTSCNSSSRKIKNAEDKVLDAKEAVIDTKIDLTQARQVSVNEFQQFKTDFQNLISSNEKKIAGLKLSIADASQKNKVQFGKKLSVLEKRNNELKIKLAEYEKDETDQWKAFKLEFKHDMDELGKAFSDFTVNNKK